MAIIGAHMLLYTPEPEALRATLRDVLGWEYIEDHPGWLIFKLPPAELGVHPTDGETKHELFLMCDDLEATMDELRGKGIEFRGEPTIEPWGTWITMILPGGLHMTLYRHTHESPLEI